MEMDIEISKIRIVDNPRVNFGHVEELARSIDESGLLHPITVRPIDADDEFELIAGECRIRAHKLLNRHTIRANVEDVDEETAKDLRLIENIQRKDLHFFEEADALNSYVTGQKCSVETLMLRIGKSRLWVEKRLEIAKLGKDIRDLIVKNRLSLGHALALARVEDKKQQKEMLKSALQHSFSSRAMDENSQYSFKEIAGANFDTSDCKNCSCNGSKQADLFETGKVLTGRCMKPKCYLKKLAVFRAELKKTLEAQNVMVALESGDYAKDEKVTNGYDRVSEWDTTPAQRRQLMKDPKGLVTVSQNGSKTLYFKGNWRKLLASKNGKKSVEALEQLEKDKQRQRKQVLSNRLCKYMFGFYQQKVKEKLKPGTLQSKVLSLFALERLLQWNTVGGHSGLNLHSMEELLTMKERAVDDEIRKASLLYLKSMQLEEVKQHAQSVGTVLDKDFAMTEEFLNLFGKEQLMKLSKEVKADTSSAKKKSELVSAILKGSNGAVPKSVMKI